MAATTPIAATTRVQTRRIGFSDIILTGTALFAFGWAVARAFIQSISIDEAETYLVFVKRGWRFVFWPASNNHVLNSLLIRLFTHWFGTSQFTVRLPALLGAAVYMCAAYLLARLMSRRLVIQWPVLVCLIFNPLLFDFYVAARGYSLAAGFLLLAIAIVARCRLRAEPAPASSLRACAIASVCFGLSFAGNFSFALADAAVLLTLLLWMWLPGRSVRWLLSVAAALVVPGLAVTLLIAGPTLFHWPSGQLYFGANSMGESLSSVYYPSLSRMEYFQAPSLVGKILDRVRTAVVPAIGVLALIQWVLIVAQKSWRSNKQNRWLASFAVVTGAALAITLGLHFGAFHFVHLLLPKHRTGLFLIPFTTLLVCAIIAIPMRDNWGRIVQGVSIAALFCLGGYYLTCLRLHYFEEWWWDADVKDAYQVLAALNHRCSVSTASADGLYGGSLNFYRALSGRENIPEFEVLACCIPGRDAYVLSAETNGDFLKANKLVPIFRGHWASTLVALSPQAAEKVAASGCYAMPPSSGSHVP